MLSASITKQFVRANGLPSFTDEGDEVLPIGRITSAIVDVAVECGRAAQRFDQDPKSGPTDPLMVDLRLQEQNRRGTPKHSVARLAASKALNRARRKIRRRESVLRERPGEPGETREMLGNAEETPGAPGRAPESSRELRGSPESSRELRRVLEPRGAGGSHLS